MQKRHPLKPPHLPELKFLSVRCSNKTHYSQYALMILAESHVSGYDFSEMPPLQLPELLPEFQDTLDFPFFFSADSQRIVISSSLRTSPFSRTFVFFVFLFAVVFFAIFLNFFLVFYFVSYLICWICRQNEKGYVSEELRQKNTAAFAAVLR